MELRGKELMKKVLIALILFVLLCSYMLPSTVHAAKDDGIDWAGILIEPLSFFVKGLGDAVINITQKFMIPGSPKAIRKRAGDTPEDSEVKIRPKIFYSAAAIFANKIPVMDINFLNPTIKNPFINSGKDLTDDQLRQEGYTKKQIDNIHEMKNAGDNLEDAGNSAAILSGVVAKWYVALRNIAIVGLLIVLIYIGIRILISATSEETAKYKTMLKDWVVALALAMLLQFIIAFLVTANEYVISFFNMDSVYNQDGDVLMNSIRSSIDDENINSITSFGFTIMYTTMVFYVTIFTIRYIKRVVYLAFLTLISPMVALTYPIDKARDGKAQAFGMWFREYLFNLLIQPVHLLLYIVLISSAIELAKSNMIYALIAIGFILQAESFVKKIFGMQSEGLDAASGFAAGAMFSAGLSGLRNGTGLLSKGFGKDEAKKNVKMAAGLGGDDSSGKNAPSIAGSFNNNVKDDINKAKGKGKKKLKLRNKLTNKVGGVTKKALNKGKDALGRGKKALKLSKAGNVARKFKNSKAGKFIDKKGTAIGDAAKTAGRAISRAGRGTMAVKDKYAGRFYGKAIKKAARLTAMGLGAGTMATIGVSAGLASDDDSQVLSLGAAGAAGGAAIGKGAFNAVDGGKDRIKEGYDRFQEGYQGENYEQYRNKVDKRQYKNNAEVRNHYRSEYGDNWKDVMNEEASYMDYGLRGEKDLKAARELKEQYSDATKEQVASIIGAKDVTKKDLLDDSKYKDLEKYYKDLHGEDKGEQIMSMLKHANGIKEPKK